MKKDPFRDQKYRLLDIMKKHDVPAFREFIRDNSDQFSELKADQIASDSYLFDVLHLYKANFLFLGPLYYESVNYCLDQGIIHMSQEAERLFREAEGNPEAVVKCAMTPPDEECPNGCYDSDYLPECCGHKYGK